MQSDVEKLEGLPVAPFMDREKVSHLRSHISRVVQDVINVIYTKLYNMTSVTSVMCHLLSTNVCNGKVF